MGCCVDTNGTFRVNYNASWGTCGKMSFYNGGGFLHIKASVAGTYLTPDANTNSYSTIHKNANEEITTVHTISQSSAPTMFIAD